MNRKILTFQLGLVVVDVHKYQRVEMVVQSHKNERKLTVMKRTDLQK